MRNIQFASAGSLASRAIQRARSCSRFETVTHHQLPDDQKSVVARTHVLKQENILAVHVSQSSHCNHRHIKALCITFAGGDVNVHHMAINNVTIEN